MLIRVLMVRLLAIFAATLSLTGTSAAAAQSARAAFGHNLVTNGSFEDDGPGSLDINHVMRPSGWETDGNTTVLQYGGFDGLPRSSAHDESINTALGKSFLAGGPRSSVSFAWQRIDLQWAAGRIRKGRVMYVLSAALGGRTGKADFATVWLQFVDGTLPWPKQACFSRNRCEAMGVRPVFRIDRNGKTIFRRAACYGSVPENGVGARVSVGAFSSGGAHNHGYVDDVSLVLVTERPRGLSECIASGRDAAARFAIPANQVDKASRGCIAKEHVILATAFGVMIALLTMLLMRHEGMKPYKRALTVRGRTVHVWLVTRKSFLHFVEVAALGATFAVIVVLALSRAETLADTACALRENLLPQPWAYQPIIGLLLIGFDILAGAVVFLHHPVMKRTVLRVAIFVGACELAVAGLKVWTPTAEELDRVVAFLLILTLALAYLWLALRESIRKYPQELRWAIFFTLLLPILQPVFALRNVHAIESQRIVRGGDHRSFDIVGDRGQFSGILFYGPTSLDYGESDRVVFNAHLSQVRDVPPKSCLVPRFSAPGFRVQNVSDEPVALSNRNIRWEWVVTPTAEGRQAIFINVLYNPGCVAAKPGIVAGERSIATLFSQTDWIWISRRWFSLEDMNSALPWITFVGALVALVVGAFDIKEHSNKEKDKKGPTPPDGATPRE